MFSLQENMSSSASNYSYYVYYGNSSVANPPANKSKIYMWYDDGSTNRISQYRKGRVDFSGHGGAYKDTITWNAAGYYIWDTRDNFGDSMRPLTVRERDVYVEYEECQTNAWPTDMTTGLLMRYICSTGCSSSTEDSNHFYFYLWSDSDY